MKYFIFILTILFSLGCNSSTCPNIEVCFTPEQNCTQEIINTASKAQKSILVQAYEFTSEPIARSIIEAKERGVDVKVIFDKTEVVHKYSIPIVKELLSDKVKIPIWIDHKPAIAHNKIIIDNQKVVTGSFNFTDAAQNKNAENLLIIDSNTIAQKYTENWYTRQELSTPLS